MKVLIAIIAMFIIALPVQTYAQDTKPAAKVQVAKLSKSHSCTSEDLRIWSTQARAKGLRGVQAALYVAERVREERGSCKNFNQS